MITIHQTNQRTEKLTDKFQIQEWPKYDIEHYGRKMDNYGYKRFCFYARDHKKIVGVIEGWCECGVMTITELLIKKDCIGTGIGTKLLKKAEEFSQKYFVHRIVLNTGKNWAANSFYQKHGFIKTGELKDHLFHHDFVIYEKNLRP